MSKAPSQEKTQQDLHKYWNSVTSNTATRENNHPISSNNEPNIANKRIDQLNSSNSDQTTQRTKREKPQCKENYERKPQALHQRECTKLLKTRTNSSEVQAAVTSRLRPTPTPTQTLTLTLPGW